MLDLDDCTLNKTKTEDQGRHRPIWVIGPNKKLRCWEHCAVISHLIHEGTLTEGLLFMNYAYREQVTRLTQTVSRYEIVKMG